MLEDACQAHGARYPYLNNNNVRTCAYSFYPGKNLGALGDGGCITTHDPSLATLVRNLANYGQSKKYYHDYNFNTMLAYYNPDIDTSYYNKSDFVNSLVNLYNIKKRTFPLQMNKIYAIIKHNKNQTCRFFSGT